MIDYVYVLLKGIGRVQFYMASPIYEGMMEEENWVIGWTLHGAHGAIHEDV